MSTVKEIEQAIQALPKHQIEELRQWIEDYLEDELELTDEFKAQIAASEESLRRGEGRIHKRSA